MFSLLNLWGKSNSCSSFPLYFKIAIFVCKICLDLFFHHEDRHNHLSSDPNPNPKPDSNLIPIPDPKPNPNPDLDLNNNPGAL